MTPVLIVGQVAGVATLVTIAVERVGRTPTTIDPVSVVARFCPAKGLGQSLPIAGRSHIATVPAVALVPQVAVGVPAPAAVAAGNRLEGGILVVLRNRRIAKGSRGQGCAARSEERRVGKECRSR